MAIVLMSGITQTGKNKLAEKLEQKGYSRMPTLTTDKSKGNLGSGYVCVSPESMSESHESGFLLERTQHAGADYALAKATMISALDSDQDQVLVMTPEGVSKVRKYLQANNIPHVAVFLSMETTTAVESLTDKLKNNSLSRELFVSKVSALAVCEIKWSQQAYIGNTFDIVYEVSAQRNLDAIVGLIDKHVTSLNKIHQNRATRGPNK